MRKPMKKRAYVTPYSKIREELLADPEVRFYYDQIKIRKVIGTALADARKRARLTQAQVAAKAKTSQPVVARLERGAGGVPSLALLDRLALAVGLRLNLGFEKNRAA